MVIAPTRPAEGAKDNGDAALLLILAHWPPSITPQTKDAAVVLRMFRKMRVDRENTKRLGMRQGSEKD